MSETVWTISWTQNYPDWEPLEFPIVDLTLAREVLVRIMAK